MVIDNIIYKNVPSNYRDILTYGGYWIKLENLVRRNPLAVFNSSYYDSATKKWIIRNYINRNNSIDDIKRLLNKFPTKSTQNFFTFMLLNFSTIADQFISLYSTNNTWDIASLLNISQTTVRRVLGDFGLCIIDRRRYCSKQHIKRIPLVRSILGETITEYYYKGYRFDEYSPKYNLDIEFDGEWCHDPEHDRIRDNLVSSDGINIIRFDAYSTDEEIIEGLNKFLNQYNNKLS